MQIDFKKLKKELLFVPLGGAGEIGMNLNMYHFNGKWLIVDVGMGFADHNFPGVDIIVPNIEFLMAQKQNIVGIVLTHAHEDHLGAIPYLWHDIKTPIYTNNFTATVLKAKLNEHGMAGQVPIHVVKSNEKTALGPFEVELVNVTHSILENNGVMIRTEAGNIFHTGDWKIDDNPILGPLTDKERLRELGDEGILAMIGDSTNIFNHGSSGSEGDLEKSLEDLICSYSEGMVVVTTFASNVARLHSVAKAAKAANRKVVLAGRSLWRMYRAARDCGYLDDIDDFLEDKAVQGLRREEILVISTGCQGEHLAAVNKFANGTHPSIKLVKGDTIIFSSKIIPGNDKRIYELFNKFCRMGIEVLTERDHFVHVSGHPGQMDVAVMYELLKPLIAVPVHGEAIHIHEHARFAKQHGCKYSAEIMDGSVLNLSQEGPKVLGAVESGYTLIDGESMLVESSPIIRTRRKIRDNGAVFITAILDNNKKHAKVRQAFVSSPGLLDSNEDKGLIDVVISEITDMSFAKSSLGEIEKAIVIFTKKLFKKELGKFPEIVVHIVQ